MRGTWQGRTVAACAAAALAFAWHWAAGARTATLPQASSHSPPAGAGPLQGVTVILDPGHGGEDPGAVSVYGQEASYTYRAAAEISAALRAQGATVRYTVQSRALDLAPASAPALADAAGPALPYPGDARLAINNASIRVRHSPRGLWLRAAVARRVWDAAPPATRARRVFFLSLHLDDAADPDIHGSIVCVDRRRPMPLFGLLLAQALAHDGLARTERTGDDPPGLSGRELGVLNPAYNPVPQSVLLEMTTLSNFDDALRAADPQWRAQMAARIAAAILTVRQGGE